MHSLQTFQSDHQQSALLWHHYYFSTTVDECPNTKQENGGGVSETSADKNIVAKKVKNLKKKLRQIHELEAKKNSGEVNELTIEQKEKLARKDALLKELEELEENLSDDPC